MKHRVIYNLISSVSTRLLTLFSIIYTYTFVKMASCHKVPHTNQQISNSFSEDDFNKVENTINRSNYETDQEYNIDLASSVLEMIRMVNSNNSIKLKQIVDRSHYHLKKVKDCHTDDNPMLLILEAPIRDQLKTLQYNIKNLY